MILRNFRIFEKSTDRIDNENIEDSQYEVNDYGELK